MVLVHKATGIPILILKNQTSLLFHSNDKNSLKIVPTIIFYDITFKT